MNVDENFQKKTVTRLWVTVGLVILVGLVAGLAWRNQRADQIEIRPSTRQPPARAVDREILSTLASQIVALGMVELRGTPRLVIGNRLFEVGTRFTAAYNSQHYEVELVAMDRTTFTLRYRGEEVTRPIKQLERIQ